MGSLLEKMNRYPSAWLWVLVMVLLSTCMAFTLYTVGLKYMEAGRAAVLATLEPIVTSLVGVIAYQENLSPVMILGIALVLISSIIIN